MVCPQKGTAALLRGDWLLVPRVVTSSPTVACLLRDHRLQGCLQAFPTGFSSTSRPVQAYSPNIPLRGGILNGTTVHNKNLYISLFLLTIVGPIYYALKGRVKPYPSNVSSSVPNYVFKDEQHRQAGSSLRRQICVRSQCPRRVWKIKPDFFGTQRHVLWAPADPSTIEFLFCFGFVRVSCFFCQISRVFFFWGGGEIWVSKDHKFSAKKKTRVQKFRVNVIINGVIIWAFVRKACEFRHRLIIT